MKKLLLLVAFTIGVFAINQTYAANYFVNENAVDQLFNNAIEMTDLSLDMVNSNSTVLTEDKNAIVAIALDFVGLGIFGVHRFYLGTEVISGLLYPITCGGFAGIVPLVDLVVLLINMEDISAYIDNPNFFMWKDEL